MGSKGFFKGEKKKKKKSDQNTQEFSTRPTFVMPEVHSKDKKNSDW